MTEQTTKQIKQRTWQKDWFILSSLVGKDFKIKYRRSVLGVLWSVLNPLLMMVVLTIVFSTLFRFDVQYYPVYLILGQTLFTFMSDATTSAMGSILESAPLIKKIRINKWIFPLEKVTFALVNFGFSFLAAIAVMIYYHITPTVNLIFFPLLIVCIYVFSLGLGLLLAALAVFFRDIVHLWSVLLTAWTYATPLFYPFEILPEWAMPIMKWNPMYYYVNVLRESVLWGQTPAGKELIICAVCAIIALALGAFVFNKLQRKFILYV